MTLETRIKETEGKVQASAGQLQRLEQQKQTLVAAHIALQGVLDYLKRMQVEEKAAAAKLVEAGAGGEKPPVEPKA